MDTFFGPLIVLVVAMATYAGFSYIRRATRDPERERAQLAETERRIAQIEKDEGLV